MGKIYQLGVEATLDVISGKWKLIILCNLGLESLRAGELKKRIPEVTQKMLTQQLRLLEKDQIVTRKAYNQVPPKVVYSLTKKGKTLREILIAMSIWGENHIKKAQENGEDVTIVNDEYQGFLKM